MRQKLNNRMRIKICLKQLLVKKKKHSRVIHLFLMKLQLKMKNKIKMVSKNRIQTENKVKQVKPNNPINRCKMIKTNRPLMNKMIPTKLSKMIKMKIKEPFRLRVHKNTLLTRILKMTLKK